MNNQYFQNITLIEFLKSEFRNKKSSIGIGNKIGSLFSLFPSSLYNYQIKKSWNELYNSIEKKLLNFYPELNCEWNGEKPSILKLVLNQDVERIEFKFDKCHIGITPDSIYFFPYETADLDSPFYNTLEKPFRIVYNPELKKDKYSIINTISDLKSITETDKQTRLNFQLKELEEETELIINKKLQLPTLYKNNA
ncbi:hypothetical protein H7U19_16660 [Hyunsoonleella sp. SJ7]|uniref:Uncharacterized protein n=1 Tax=Hyunsoonleella aquatilis TaxID=2762758 RepID=A0A923KHA2_9FLAO|nr:hypothetical protein [Hyunsoonleella aquatilis]MBC3760041.1 hypothetical protein [Hyunsoonleella aquatilis]